MATQTEISEFLASAFPQSKCVVVKVGNASATVSHSVGVDELRPGGTVAGPVLMAVADVALYVAILGEIGIVPLTVTTSLNINFLRKPSADKKKEVSMMASAHRTLTSISWQRKNHRTSNLNWRTLQMISIRFSLG